MGSYVNTEAFSSAAHEPEDFSDLYVSGDSVNDLWQLLDRSILEPLGLIQPSKPEDIIKPRAAQTSRILRESTDRSAADSSPSPASHGPGTPYGTPPSSQIHSRRHLPRGGDFPPGFEDEYEINGKLRIPTPQGSASNSQTPFLPIGDRDLNPPGLGPHPSLGPSIGPYSEGGGMYPTMDELMRRGSGGSRLEEDPDNLLRRPPGARWDPTGPGQGRSGRGSFGGGFGNSSGGGFGGFM